MRGRPGNAVRAYQRGGPWTRPETLYFRGGKLDPLAPTSGLLLPEGWCGHPAEPRMVAVRSVEHYFQACKASSQEDFQWILLSRTAKIARRRGGPVGEGHRRIRLRSDWHLVKGAVMRFACRVKFERPGFREALRETGARPLVEDGECNYEWGGRDANGGYDGGNLLGLILMEVRSTLS